MSEYTRVTEVLSPFSGYGQVQEFILELAQIRGKNVHMVVNCHIMGLGMFGFEDIKPIHMKYYDSFLKFWGDGHKIEAQEKRFFCDKYMITGACDLICWIDGKLTLVDWKTSKNESPTWKLQASAYAYMARLAGFNIEQVLFVHLNKTGAAPTLFYYEEDFQGFLECLSVYNKYFKGKELQEYE
jgi:hypothetical protein